MQYFQCTRKVINQNAGSKPSDRNCANLELTAIDHYVAAPDSTYEWKLVGSQVTPEGTLFVVDMKSPNVAQAGRSGSNGLATLVNGLQAKGRYNQQGLDVHWAVAATAKIHQKSRSTRRSRRCGNEKCCRRIEASAQHSTGVSWRRKTRVEDDLIGYTWEPVHQDRDERWAGSWSDDQSRRSRDGHRRGIAGQRRGRQV